MKLKKGDNLIAGRLCLSTSHQLEVEARLGTTLSLGATMSVDQANRRRSAGASASSRREVLA